MNTPTVPTGMTQNGPIKAGVIGYPISHSLSPYIHGYWLKQYGIDGSYDAIEVLPEHLEQFLKNLGKNGFNGVNITLPHKEKALSIMANVDPFAQFIGAVNTVVVNQEGVLGTNTDFVGFARSLMLGAPQWNPEAGKAVVLGAGGAARAIVFALMSLGVQQIDIINRSQEKAVTIADQMAAHFHVPREKFSTPAWEDRTTALRAANLLVNTTSLGMKNQPPLEIELQHLPITAVVTDIVYNPLETALLAAARARGNHTVDGLGMLLHQAAPGFEAWFGVKPEVTEDLRNHVLAALNAR